MESSFLTLAAPASSPAAYNQWAILGIVFLIALTFAVSNIILSHFLGPKRKGDIKDTPYESGVEPAGNPHQRFNVRFYLVAMIFLVFDVEVLFFIPWITIFPHYDALQVYGLPAGLTMLSLFGAVIAFTFIVLVAYVYAAAKGVLRWD